MLKYLGENYNWREFMSKISEVLINILKVVIAILLSMLFIRLIKIIRYYPTDNFLNKFVFIGIIALICGSVCIFLKIKNGYKIAIILALALILRVFWVASINTLPISDFASMYEEAGEILSGDLSGLKDYQYLARFPHLIPMTLYISGIMKIFGSNTLVALKTLNIIFGLITVYLLYKLSDNFIENEKIKLFVALIGAIYPAFILYTSVICTENLAIPLYLLTLIIFFNAKKSEKRTVFFASGIVLAISNLFRGIGIVFLIAFLIYLLLCTLKNKYTSILCVICGYLVMTLIVSGILLGFNITQRPLWVGAEPSSATLLLKGTNFEHAGRWNIEDAEFVEEHLRDDNLVELCLDKVKERLSSKSPKEIFLFYKEKIIEQWIVGDCGGGFWAYTGASIEMNSFVVKQFQILHLIILFFSIIGLIRKGNNSLICIILFGFILLFMMIETQPRYSFVISFAFIILATTGIEYIFNLIQKGRNNGWKNKKSIREYFFE